MSIFVTPFCDKYFLTFVVSSVIFGVEYAQINKYFDAPDMSTLINVPMWIILLLFNSYFMRSVLTEFFVTQT